jgi:outer membrane protein
MRKNISPRFLVAVVLAGASMARPASAQDPAPERPEEPVGPVQPVEPVEPVAPIETPAGDDAADDPVDTAESTMRTETSRSKEQFKRIRLGDAIELALRRHPQLIAVRERITSAEARVGQAQAAFYPQVDGWLQYLRATENGALTSFMGGMPGFTRTGGSIRDNVEWYHTFNNFLVAIIARQMIYDFGRTHGAVGARRAAVKVAKMTEKLVEQRVVVGVMQAFYEVRAAREAVRVAEEALKNSIGIFELAEAGHDAGLRPPSEKARAEADVALAEVTLIRANLDLDLARASVANAIGVAGQAFEPRDQELAPPEAVASVEENIELALRNRPELRALDFQREVLSQTLRSVKGRQFPNIFSLLGANTRGHINANHPSGHESYQVVNFNVGVIVQVPIFQGLAVRKQKDELRAEMRALDGDQEAIVQAVILEVKQAMAMVRAADEASRATQKGIEAADVALETSRGRYRAGLANLIELIDAQAAYVEARSQHVRVTYDRHLARAVLSLAMGQTPTGSGSP